MWATINVEDSLPRKQMERESPPSKVKTQKPLPFQRHNNEWGGEGKEKGKEEKGEEEKEEEDERKKRRKAWGPPRFQKNLV